MFRFRTLLELAIVSSLFAAGPAVAQRAQPDEAQSAATLAERQRVWSENKAEYRQRVIRDGQASADRWLDQQAHNAGSSSPAASKRKKDCKKVRWVSRATPGFGGGAMTMSRVAVCAD